ncbi:membrane protein containing GGDEF domain [Sulfurimonas gotlandica GD1]|uniref:diguanylate cyclase n=2 Tax=Sulfurimonas TaxID=202746 RepID=H1FRT7_SULGG|nr:membrane protein containing GGDEF domain [Sulfurimonas gotlandica GD1]
MSKLHKNALLQYEDMIMNLEDKYLPVGAQFMNIHDTYDLLKNRDRGKLYNSLEQDYEKLKKHNPNLHVMHFLDTKNTTILRMHKPSSFDDDLTNIRPIVAKTNKDKKTNFGFETGKNGITYRVTIPFITRKNEHLGVLEFGIKPQYFANRLDNLLHVESEILVKTSTMKNLSYKTNFDRIGDFSVISKNSIFKNFRDKINLNKKEQIIQDKNKTYILFNDLCLRDYNNEIVGKVIIAKDITKTVIENRNSLIMLNSINIMILFICYLLIYFIFTRYSNKLISAYENIQELEIAVDTDALTGINNRTSLDSFLKANVKHENKYAIIFLDIDHFKNINDTYGHDVGDTILKELANIILKSIRLDDFFARWGGEEFVIVLKTNSIQNAVKITKNIRENIHSTLFHNSIPVTCSFGVTMIDRPDDLDMVLKRADKLLYDAKDAGRDCIKSSS